MAVAMIRILSRPDGEAPAEIRDKWIGLVLPAQSEHHGIAFSVLSHTPRKSGTAYVVSWEDAMRVLAIADPQARAWWLANVRGFGGLVFDSTCCEVVPD